MAGHSNNPVAPLTAPWKVGKPVQAYLGVAKNWAPSAARLGAFGGIMFLYFTDWTVVMTYLPFYNKKFAPRDPIV